MEQNVDPEAEKNIVILGGSFAGISAAHYILRHVRSRMPYKASYQVVIVSASSQGMCRPACPRALISDDKFPQNELFLNIPQLFQQYIYERNSYRFIQGTATELDHTNRTVSISFPTGHTVKIDFYALVIATGASTPSPLLGLTRDSDFLRTKWAEFRKALPTAKSIIIAGGGPAGIETAGELGQYLNCLANTRSCMKLENPKVAITVVTAASKILPILKLSRAEKAEEYLAKLGVTVIKEARVMTVTPTGAGTDDVASKATLTLEDGRILEADLFIPATGLKPNTSFINESLLTADGRVDTKPSTLRVDKAGPRIYAIGDASSFARPAVHNIVAAVPILGGNMKRDFLLALGNDRTAPPERIFKEDTREVQLVPIGYKMGVGAAMGIGMPAWLVWFIKGRNYWVSFSKGLWTGRTWAQER